jgi:hypothetical protein
MERLTHKRENGIKRGYWSPNKKQELEESHDAKASERFHTPAAYQSYSVEDYLRKMGVDIKEVTGDE